MGKGGDDKRNERMKEYSEGEIKSKGEVYWWWVEGWGWEVEEKIGKWGGWEEVGEGIMGDLEKEG